MADEGIRLPSDSTVASQKIHRGSGPPEGLAAPANNRASSRPTPLMTVVLKSTPILVGEQEALYQVLLQNNPKSNPPITLNIDTEITPGTSLLLVLDSEGNYQPVEKPTQDQLRQLIKLELEFWQTHLVPQANLKEKLTLPNTQLLMQLSNELPILKPLINFLISRPTHITANHIQQVLSQFQSIAHPTVSSLPSQLTPTKQPIWPVVNKPQPTSTLAIPDKTPEQKTNQMVAGKQSIQIQFSQPLIIKDFRLTEPVGNLTKAREFLWIQEAPQATLSSKNTLTPQSTEPRLKLQFAGQVYQLPEKIGNRILISPDTLNNITSVRFSQVTQPSAHTGLPQMANITERNQNSSPINFNKVFRPVVSKITEEQLILRPIIRAAQGSGNNTAIQTESQPTQLKLSELPLAPSSIPLMKAALVKATPELLPIEIRLNSWLQEISKTLSQHPALTLADLKHKANQTLQTPSTPLFENSLLKEGQSEAKKTASSDIDNALLQLRGTLETTLARIQHSAVQTAAQQWSTPDQPVNQLHLPLIWLGLTHWADIEWWQEKRRSDNEKDKKSKPVSLFKMRIYLTLEPLQEICAEIETGNKRTHLTFWTEDQTTLAHLHKLLPKLEQWTEGLGERQLQTKHGLPLRKSKTEKSQNESHLVDVRT